MINPFKTKSKNLSPYPLKGEQRGGGVKYLDLSDLTFSMPLLNFLKNLLELQADF